MIDSDRALADCWFACDVDLARMMYVPDVGRAGQHSHVHLAPAPGRSSDQVTMEAGQRLFSIEISTSNRYPIIPSLQYAEMTAAPRSLARLTIVRPRATSALPTARRLNHDVKPEGYEAAKARAWYLDEAKPAVRRQPVFTTYNPSSTLPTPTVQVPIPPLPAGVPPEARALHAFLTTDPLFVPHSVIVLDTSKTSAASSYADQGLVGTSILGGRRRSGLRATIKASDESSTIQVGDRDVGAFWDWIVVAQIGARGKGAVGRAERALRKWLQEHPVDSEQTARRSKFRTLSPPDAEWAIVEAGEGICVNLMTEEGRDNSLAVLMDEPAQNRPSAIMGQTRSFSTSSRAMADSPGKLGEPTVFDSKAQPTSRHATPEEQRKYIAGDRRARPATLPLHRAQEEAFDGPSRPRMMYERPKEARELPQLKSRWGLYALATALGLGAWGAFLLHATNAERLSSSVLRQVTYSLRNSDDVRRVLGDRVHYAPNWWGFGEPWISGTVNLMQGKVDLKFRIQGTQQQATVYFTSVRPAEDAEFRIVRYKVVADDGRVIQMA